MKQFFTHDMPLLVALIAALAYLYRLIGNIFANDAHEIYVATRNARMIERASTDYVSARKTYACVPDAWDDDAEWFPITASGTGTRRAVTRFDVPMVSYHRTR